MDTPPFNLVLCYSYGIQAYEKAVQLKEKT
jgi:hypothetical protein